MSRRILGFLARDGVIPATAIVSIIITSNTCWDLTESPLGNIFGGLVIGGIGGSIIQALTPFTVRPFVSGGIICLTGANMFARSMGWIPPPRDINIVVINHE